MDKKPTKKVKTLKKAKKLEAAKPLSRGVITKSDFGRRFTQ